jgi:hypothetical protein
MMGLDEMGYEHEDEHEVMHSYNTNMHAYQRSYAKFVCCPSTLLSRIEADIARAASYIILCRASRGSVRPRLRCCVG